MTNNLVRYLIFTFCLLVFSVSALAEQLYYIYKDPKGRTYIEDSISANHAKYGYRVVNSQGATLKVVPSTREQKRKEEQRRKRTAAAKEKNKNQRRDEYLLQSFVDVEDIRQAGNKKIMAIQAQVETTTNHIKAFEENLKQLEAQIEQADRDGREITQKEVDNIQRIKDSIQQNKLFAQRKIKEQKDIQKEYLEYMERFQALKAGK